MSNIIQFLESMGKDATLSNMSQEDYTLAVKALRVDDEAQYALINRDQEVLNNLLGGRTKMMMMLVPAEDDEGEGKDDDNKDEDHKKDEKPSVN